MTTQEIIEHFIHAVTTQIRNEISDKVADALLPPDITVTKNDRSNGVAHATVIRKVSAPKVARRKGPIQLCPVPRCKNRAAPVFGMVCSNHKDVAKATIKKYREARRAKK